MARAAWLPGIPLLSGAHNDLAGAYKRPWSWPNVSRLPGSTAGSRCESLLCVGGRRGRSPELRTWPSVSCRAVLGKDAVVVDARLREFHSPGDQTVPEKEDVLPRSAGGTCEWRERLPAAVDWTRFDRQTEATSSRGFFRTVRSLAECSG